MSEVNEQGAHTYWNEQWSSEAGRDGWLKPEPDVEAFIPQIKSDKARNAVDLGSGVGRHSLYLARQGFNVTAIDLSANGLHHLHEKAEQEGLKIDLRIAAMTDLKRVRCYQKPGPTEVDEQWVIADAAIDYLLAWNVIYHGDLDTLQRSLREIARVLRPGGWFQGTLLSKHNANFRVGREIAADTWVNEEVDDKGHPHCYVNASEMSSYLWDAGMELMQLYHREHERPGSYHWHLVAQRRARIHPNERETP
jgi:2-polyprenyl-3-methyl-5-hydroxy-6-metoxy-1,4-benzoquinol methylase